MDRERVVREYGFTLLIHADLWTDTTCYSHFEPINRQGAEDEKAFVPCSSSSIKNKIQSILRDMQA
jgi:hypothetical protein